MKQRAAFAAVMTIVIALAAGLRLPQLANRPMHGDEAVHAVKFRDLLEHGDYRYDPHEYHGPTLNYFTLLVTECLRKDLLVEVTEHDLRLVPALFGIALVAAVSLLSNALRPTGTLLAATFTAVSPAMAFYSRYYIQETLLVFFTFGALMSTWYLWCDLNPENRDRALSTKTKSYSARIMTWLVLLGICLGLMHATKETCVIAVVGLIVAVATTLPEVFRVAARSWVLSLLVVLSSAALVSALLVTCLWQHPNAAVDSWSTYLQYVGRAGGAGSAGTHVYPSYHYLRLLMWWRRGTGPLWTELPVALLALVAVGGAVVGPGLPRSELRFLRFLAVYTLVVWLVYALIPYKTPWCVLSLMQGLVLLAGSGGALIIGWSSPGIRRACAALAITAVVAFSAYQAFRAVLIECEDPTNPYVYAHTTKDVPALAEVLTRIAACDTQGCSIGVQVIAPDDDYWPLPWYLRHFSQVGWYRTMPQGPAASILVVHAAQESDLTKYLYQDQPSGQRFLYVPVPVGQQGQDWFLRPGVALRAYVRLELWNNFSRLDPRSAEFIRRTDFPAPSLAAIRSD